jgi:hypothetical protein
MNYLASGVLIIVMDVVNANILEALCAIDGPSTFTPGRPVTEDQTRDFQFRPW